MNFQASINNEYFFFMPVPNMISISKFSDSFQYEEYVEYNYELHNPSQNGGKERKTNKNPLDPTPVSTHLGRQVILYLLEKRRTDYRNYTAGITSGGSE